MALARRLMRMKTARGRPSTSDLLGAGEPVFEWDVGASGTWDCCREHEPQTLCEEASWAAIRPSREVSDGHDC